MHYHGLVRLADWLEPAALASGPPTSEIQIARTGTWEHPEYGKFTISEAVLQEFVDNFYNGTRGVELAIDQAHRPDDGAAGWVRELHKRGSELWATIEWTPVGVQLISDGIFRYFSPEFAPRYTDPETGAENRNVLLGGGLTNRPFIKHMHPILLSEGGATVMVWPRDVADGDTEEEATMELSEQVRTALGLSEDVDAAGLVAAVEQFIAGQAETPEVARLTEENQTLNDANRQLAERVTGLEERLRRGEWERYRDGQLREGRLTMALAEQFEPLYLSDPERATAIIGALPKAVDLSERGSDSGEPVSDDTPDKLFLAEVTTYQTEHKVDFATAMREVSQRKPDLAAAYQQHARGR